MYDAGTKIHPDTLQQFVMRMMAGWPSSSSSASEGGGGEKDRGGRPKPTMVNTNSAASSKALPGGAGGLSGGGSGAGDGSGGAAPFHSFAHAVDSLIFITKLLHPALCGGQRYKDKKNIYVKAHPDLM